MRALVVTVLLLYALPAVAQERERFNYDVTWGYADVANVTLQRGCPHKGYVPAKLHAKSHGVAEQIHDFEIRLDSFEGLDGRTLEGRTFIKEKGEGRKFRTRFAESGSAFAQKWFRKKDSTLRLELRPGTFDLLSWFFALRAEKLVKGTTHSFYVWDGWKLTRVTALVGATERIWTPRGTYRARRVELTRMRLHHSRDKAYQRKAAAEDVGTMWFSEDATRTPVAMDFRAPVGVAKLRLQRHTHAKCK